MSNEDDSMRPFEDAVAILVVLTTGLRDHHRDGFDAAKADLLLLTRGKASALAYVRRLVAAELNCPHDPQWRERVDNQSSQISAAVMEMNAANLMSSLS